MCLSRAAAVALLLAASAARADATRTVSLADVIAAVPSAPEAPIAPGEVRAAEAEADAAGAWPAAPTLRGGTSRLTATLSLGVTVPLPIFGTLGAARDEARAKARVVRSEATIESRDLRRRAVAAWIALARADDEVGVRAAEAAQADALVTMTRTRLEAGTSAEVDVSMAVAAQARARVAVSAAQRAREAAGAQLAALLGWDPARPLASDGTWPGATLDASLDGLRARLAAHPEHAAATARVDAATAAAARVRTLRIPGVALDVEANIDDPTLPRRRGDDHDGHGTDLLAGVTLELPIFAHVGDQLRAAAATTTVAKARLAATDAQLAGGLVASYRTWEAARDSAAALAAEVVPAQEKATALAEQAFREGARDLATALQAERDLAAVRAELAGARAELAMAWIELQVAAGEEPGGAR
ncbi:MAG TPA: TolC family protein [Kofleriaceae bacterium]|jgi:multidrug efflux system outer membrane protein